MKKVSITVSEGFWSEVRVRALKEGKTTGRVIEDVFMRNSEKPQAEIKKQLAPILPDDEPFVSEPKYVPSYSDGNIKPIPKDLPKEKKLEALKTYFNPMPKKKVNG